MVFFSKLGQLVLSLAILIVMHEMGHFVFAKLFKTRVEKFFLFFDPWFALFKKKIGDTVYGIGWLPLGGYVKISGMIDESMDKEQLAKPPQPWEFRSKKAWQRLLIMLGGVTVNFLLAVVIYIMVLHIWGEKYIPNKNLTDGVMVNEIGKQMGLRDGDKILKVGDKELKRWESFTAEIWINEADKITIQRDGKVMELPLHDSIIPILGNRREPTAPIFPRYPFIVTKIIVDRPAYLAGMKPGDKIVQLNGTPIRYYDEYQAGMKGMSNDTVVIGVEREGKIVELPVVCDKDGLIGVESQVTSELLYQVYDPVEIRYSLLESVPAGINKGIDRTKDYLLSLQKLFKFKKYKAHESLGGFITIGRMFPAKWNWESFWNFTAFLSLILAIMNLLPIPALDGGHVMFLLFEIISGRKPGDKFMEYAQIVGMVILLALLLYANMNDVLGLFQK